MSSFTCAYFAHTEHKGTSSQLAFVFFRGCTQLIGDLGALQDKKLLWKLELEGCYGLQGSVESFCQLEKLQFLNVEDTHLNGLSPRIRMKVICKPSILGFHKISRS